MDSTSSRQQLSHHSIANLFYSDVVKWRQLAAKLWSLVIVFALVLIHSTTANHALLTDLTGFITGFFFTLFSLQFWFYSVIILATFAALSMFYDQLFRVTPKVYSNNLDKLGQIAYSLHSLFIGVSFVATFLISLLLLQFYNTKNSKSIDFASVLSFCALSNLITNFNASFTHNYLLNWPIVEQAKYPRFKSNVYSIFLSTTKLTFTHIFVWYFFNIFTDFFNVNISTLSVAFKLSFIITMCRLMSWHVYEIFLTEIYYFDIQPKTHMGMSLSMAMSLRSHPYIQTLAMIDFAHLSIYSEVRRKKILTLSFPSGQPLIWMKICNEALTAVVSFMDLFNLDEKEHGGSRSDSLAGISSKFISSTTQAHKRASVALTSPMRDASAAAYSSAISPTRQVTTTNEKSTAATWFNKLEQFVLNKLKHQKLCASIYSENQNYKLHRMFVDSLMITNVLRGLSNMVMASRQEDEYGIVQQTLVDIITIFVQLQKVLEKLNTANTQLSVSFKVLQKPHANEIELLMQKLPFVLNESINKITFTFGTTLKSLSLSDEVFKRLERHYVIE